MARDRRLAPRLRALRECGLGRGPLRHPQDRGCGHGDEREHRRQRGRAGPCAAASRPTPAASASTAAAHNPDNQRPRHRLADRAATGSRPRSPPSGWRGSAAAAPSTAPGCGRRSRKRGNEGDDHERHRQPQPERGEHQHRSRRRQQQRGPQRGAEERPGAGRRDERGQRAGAEAAAPGELAASTGSSNTRSRLSVIAVASSSSSMIVRGSCSWNAQPAALPPARIASSAAPSSAGADHRPRRIGQRIAPRAASRIARRAAPDAAPSSARIGNTHGIRLSSIPPAIAPSTANRIALAPSSPIASPPRGTSPGVALNSSPRPSPSASTPANSRGRPP